MIEAAIIPTLSKPSGDAAPAREDIASGFSFATALGALEARAAQSLETHGATPQQNSLAQSKSANTATKDAPSPQTSQQPAAQTMNTAEAATQTAQTTKENAAPAPANTPVLTAQTAPAPLPVAPAVIAATPLPPQQQGVTTAKLETAPLRTGDLAKPDAPKTPRPTAPAQPQAPAQDFAKLIAQRLNHGATQFELRLDPPELGRIEANLRLADDGDNILALKFENQTTLDLFARDESALRNALSHTGFDFNRERVVFELANEESSGAFASADILTVYEPHFAAPWSEGAVDIRI